MFGDQAPIFGVPIVPPTPPVPNPPRPFGVQNVEKAKTVVPWVRAFKIADNQSPLPQDRIFFNFNYFDNLNGDVNRRIGAPVSNINVFRYQLGFEKTFLDGYASIGLRDSINTLSANSLTPGLGGTSTSMGDLDIFMKYVLWENLQSAQPTISNRFASGPTFASTQANGGLVSTGLAVRTPTGPGNFAGASFSRSFRNTALQPFVGYYWSQGRFYFQGFESIDVPLDQRDVTMLFNDVGIGYYLYRSQNLNQWINAIAPTFEVHANIPLNHRDVFNVNDVAGTADTVDLTYGVNTLFGRRSLLSCAIVTPVTGPNAFDFEVIALLNIYFGGASRSPRVATPILGR